MPQPSTEAVSDTQGRGIVYAIIGVLIFSTQDAMAKWLAADYSVMQIVFFRGVFALIPCAFVVHRSGGWDALRTRRFHVHMARAVLLVGALVTFYLAIRTMPLADAIAITFAAPLFMTALSAPLLGEPVGIRRWAAVLVGFAGVLIVARPGADIFDTAALLAVTASLLYAVAMLVTRHLTRSDTSAAIMVYFTLASIVAGGAFMPFQWVTPTAFDAALMAGLGLIGGCGAWFVVQSFRFAPVAVIAPYDYSGLVWATFYGFWLWGDVPGAAVVTGAAVIVGSNLYVLHREARRGTKRPETPQRPE